MWGPAASSGNAALFATFLGHTLRMSKAYFAAVPFCHPTFNLPDGRADLHEQYITGWVVGLARKTDRHFAYPSFNFYLDQEYEI